MRQPIIASIRDATVDAFCLRWKMMIIIKIEITRSACLCG